MFCLPHIFNISDFLPQSSFYASTYNTMRIEINFSFYHLR